MWLVLAAICYQTLNETVVLPCNHRFCFQCISKFVYSASGMQCAVCQQHVLLTHEQIHLPSNNPEQAGAPPLDIHLPSHGAPLHDVPQTAKRQKLEGEHSGQPSSHRQLYSIATDTNLINNTSEEFDQHRFGNTTGVPYYSMDSIDSGATAVYGGTDDGRLHSHGMQTTYRSMQAEPLDRCAQQLKTLSSRLCLN